MSQKIPPTSNDLFKWRKYDLPDPSCPPDTFVIRRPRLTKIVDFKDFAPPVNIPSTANFEVDEYVFHSKRFVNSDGHSTWHWVYEGEVIC